MYSWKEIAQMYKDEVINLQNEIDVCLDTLSVKSPNCIRNSSNTLVKSLEGSCENFRFIESFEESVSDGLSKVIIEKTNKKNKEKSELAGSYISSESEISEKEFREIESELSAIKDLNKRVLAILDRCSILCVVNWMNRNVKRYKIIGDLFPKDNVLLVLDKKSKKERTIKVIGSGIEVEGKTREFGSDIDPFDVPRQRTYLIDPKESIKDLYIFVKCSTGDKTAIPYARINGKFIKHMLFDPIRKRFVGKKACILEKTGYNKDVGSSYSIDEMLNKCRS